MKTKKNTMLKLLIVALIATSCLAIIASCTSKYGKEVTYYDVNDGGSIYFDGKGNAVLGNLECTYEIKNNTYYISGIEDDNPTMFKIVKDGILVPAYQSFNTFLNVDKRTGYLDNASFTFIGSTFVLGPEGTFRALYNNNIIAYGNYYFNDGVLILEYTYQISGNQIDYSVIYNAFYIEENTGNMTGVLLKDPAYYKQWHFDDNNNNNGNNNSASHALTYDFNYSDAANTTQRVKKGENVNLITPSRNGYVFKGWYYNCEKVESGIWQYDTDVTLTAYWEIITYTITYNTDGGILPAYSPTDFSAGYYPSLPVPNKQNMNFLGWYENADFSGEQITEISKLKNYVLYAKYTDAVLCEFELSFDETYYSVAGYEGNPQYINIPRAYNNLPVKEIASKAFEYCSSLINITIPDSVTYMGTSAFYGCSSLTGVYITDIASWCAIEFDNDYSNPLSYAHNLYLNNELVTELKIPEGVTSIGSYAFYDCSSLTSIEIPNSVTSIGDEAFDTKLCKRYSSCYYLPTSKSNYGFLYTTVSRDVKNIKVHTECNTINSYAFYNCGSLTSIEIPNSVTSIGYMAFSWCNSLTSIVIPSSVTSIGSYAFYDCSSLTSVEIPSSVTSIGSYAFYNCSSLTSIVIPNSVTSIGSWAFNGCSSLSKVYYKGSTSDWNKITIGENNYYLTSATYYYSETAPADDGNYWHYDTDGKTLVIWKKTY